MFQTNLNHWLQSFDNPYFSKFMVIVSMMGTVYFLTLIAFLFIAGVDFKKGMLSINIFMWAVLITLLLKTCIDYPRPLAVDPTLKSFGFAKGNDLRELAPKEFFGLFSDDLLKEIRAQKAGRYGLPSGHTSLITAMFVSFAVFFRKKWFTWLSIILVALTILSRLYLAQHFLGDVTGGLILGSFLIYVFYKLVGYLQIERREEITGNTYFFFLLPIITILLFVYFPAFQAGSFMGINLGFLAAMKIWGIPKLSLSVGRRIINVIIFFLLNFSGVYLLSKSSIPHHGLISSLTFTMIMSCTFLLSVTIAKKLKLITF